MGETLFEALRGKMKKGYSARVKCNNCGHFSEITIPKGITIADHLGTDSGVCPMCGCATLNQIQIKKPDAVASKKKIVVKEDDIDKNKADERKAEEVKAKKQKEQDINLWGPKPN